MKRFIRFFTDTIFRKQFRSPWMNKMARQYRLIFYTARGLQDHATVIRCAALTFYTLISIVPILAVVFAIVKGFGIIDSLIANLYSLVPQTPEIVDYMVEFADKTLANTKSGVVAVVGIVMLFWAVIRVFGSIESAFNNIWEVSKTRSIASKYPVYITIVVVVPLLWAAGSGTAAWMRSAIDIPDTTLAVISKAISLIAVWTAFSYLYRVIPNTNVRLGSAVTAGIIAGTGFMIFQWGYVYIQQMMTSYNAIYGSFAALPLFLLWVQYSWTIFLFGGELSFAYQNVDKFDEERESLKLDYNSRRKVALAAMTVVVEHFEACGGSISVSQIRRRLDMPTRIVNSVLGSLVEARMLVEVPSDGKGDEPRYMLARTPDKLTLYGVLESMDLSGDTLRLHDPQGVLERSSRALDDLKNAARQSDKNINLSQLAANESCDNNRKR